ncbi:hypothetical protein [Virgibacillus phasianinus]|nr:hypothetical protein [Virgibacillus phasianinus]
MSGKKMNERNQNMLKSKKITKWEGETREQKRHKSMLEKVKQWEKEGYHC